MCTSLLSENKQQKDDYMNKKSQSGPPDKWDIFFTIFLPVSLVIGWIVTILVWIAEMNK